jgi:hypothetical protein
MSSHFESHFWPFTEVLRKMWVEVTRKNDGPTLARRIRTATKRLGAFCPPYVFQGRNNSDF